MKTQQPQTCTRELCVSELLRGGAAQLAAHGIATPRLDAELLLAHALGCTRLRLYADAKKPAAPAASARYRKLLAQRARRVSVAQLIGEKEFWSLPLAVTKDVLVPRPDSETLVEAVLARQGNLHAAAGAQRELQVLDLGTGSGALALALAREWPQARITASDCSAAALAVAARNARRHGLSARVQFVCGDAFAPLAGRRFDVIISNPPYLCRSEAATLQPELQHEPPQALFAAAGGTAMLRRITAQAAGMLKPGGLLALEHAPQQLQALQTWLRAGGFFEVQSFRDLAGKARAITARNSAAAAAAAKRAA